ncbi:tRNA (adenosine(37)-N6)-threonylcarbamoyltransferase complex ATPase subunit type 1 TsaE [Mycoplasma procyoni]|uniref:tRNA (adenosine(37)-N6)-threonylcarbamoyltransferase complex ATPase subunit type 1 TsaE n=1 Tax=Mycoplasma procyoni TaxID=568784 RepID=UPI00197BA4FD|nr:tRNA (adenosine(37)-N6)-threonylcarbamoyltransferase complex ATPase subunit type 1 TsaE [Mycoplasma procyoni]MBN3535113.1 tRNA (adenosine(37)-N6)-threonylcarbamoyltransferase complex ATPase subunit type 1 TsaE [Mycoplasma procyoni]
MFYKEIKTTNDTEIELVVKEIFENDWKFLYLNGDLGAGKTTLTKAIAKKLGIKENITSPTFNIMKIYKGLVHIDAYNINGDLDEFEDYFEDNKVIIEWSNNLDLNYENVLEIDILFDQENNRIYRIKKEK